jgi:hypothetical protein
MANCVLGEHSKKKLEIVQLHNTAVKCRIQDLSAGMEKQLVLRLNPVLLFQCKLMKQQKCQYIISHLLLMTLPGSEIHTVSDRLGGRCAKLREFDRYYT